MKTNAARLLDSLGIRYEVREYTVDPEDLAAESVAVKIGMPAEQVFKTLVARGDDRIAGTIAFVGTLSSVPADRDSGLAQALKNAAQLLSRDLGRGREPVVTARSASA